MKVRCKNSVDPANYHLRAGCEITAGKIYEGQIVEKAWVERMVVFNDQRQWKDYPLENFEPAWQPD